MSRQLGLDRQCCLILHPVGKQKWPIPQQKYSSASIIFNIVGNSEWRRVEILPFPSEP